MSIGRYQLGLSDTFGTNCDFRVDVNVETYNMSDRDAEELTKALSAVFTDCYRKFCDGRARHLGRPNAREEVTAKEEP